MNNVQQIKAARDFASRWQGKGYEKGESQVFWTEFLTDVFGVEHPSEFLHFEQQVHLDHTSFIDAYIPCTHVMIEQKSIEKDLGTAIRQSDGSLLNPFQQAKRYAAELPYSQRPRWIVTCNFREFWVYDMEQPNGEPQKILLANLGEEYYRLQFLVDEGNEHLKREMEVSVKAGELVGVIYDKLLEQYEVVESQKSKVESEINSSALQQDPQINSSASQHSHQINSPAPQQGSQINSSASRYSHQINSPAPLAGRGLGGGANTEDILRSLNILCVRLVFCLYAEDAGLFPTRTYFHDYLAQFPAKHIRKALIDLFEVLDTPLDQRDPYLDEDLAAFPYVNGGLFGKIGNGELSGLSEGNNSPNSLNSQFKLIIPQFNDDLKNLLLEKASADFDWSEISPTIFGAVFESTLNPETRRSGGMHYTSIENIHKVIDPLFLNELRAEFEELKRTSMSAQKRYKLQDFQNKLASLTFFDPACGSGNFLTETFLSLRRLENDVIQAMYGGANILTFDTLIKVNISQFYGIEINDFACTVAKTALWIAEHQMMQQTSMIAGKPIDFLPLKTNAYIHEGNALRTDWASLFGVSKENSITISEGTKETKNEASSDSLHSLTTINGELSKLSEGNNSPNSSNSPTNHFPDYIIGNPPFVGYSLQTKEQKEDILNIYKDEKGKPYKTAGKIDYVAGWYWKAAELMQLAAQANSPSILEGVPAGRGRKNIKAALVSTNSITQGEQVAAIWQPLYERFGINIDFAYRTFRWDSEAEQKAHVHCVIIGFSIDQNRSFRVDTNQLPRPACGEGAGGGENTAEPRKINWGNNPHPQPHIMNNPQMREYRRELRSNGTPAEGVLWKMLKAKQVGGLQFRRQFSVENYILDFYCPAIRLAVELDGDYHYHWSQPELDYERDRVLWERHGIRVLRFENQVVFQNPQTIIESILQHQEMIQLAAEDAAYLKWQAEVESELNNTLQTENESLPRPLTPSPQAGWGSEITLDYTTPNCVTPDYTTSNRAALDYRDTIGIPKGYKKQIFLNDQQTIDAKNINPYLIDAPTVWIPSRQHPLCDVPEMVTGNRPADGGHLIIEAEDYEDFVKKEPAALPFIKRLTGAMEYINNKPRYCLWLVGVQPQQLRSMPLVMERVKACREDRLQGAPDRQKLADTPWLFRETKNPDTYIIVPATSSENRRYIPLGFLDKNTIPTNSAVIIPSATLYHFGVLTSNVHMAWMRVVCGRLEMRYRYSKDIVYNNFPWCNPADEQRARIERTAQAILDARALYPDSSLADLYDENTMPPELRRAHQENDKAVMQAYGFKIGMTESDCVAELFKMYQQLTK